MKHPRFSPFVVGSFVTILLASSAWAQMSVEKIAAVDRTLQSIKALYNKMPANKQILLDGTANAVRLADTWHTMGMRLADPTFKPRSASVLPPPSPGIIPVSATGAAKDLTFSSMGGFTQSESSTARCGNNVVVGFNDSGSIFQTPYFFTGTGGQSLSGFGYSSDGGATFTDGGPFDPGPGLGNFAFGDPVVTCGNTNTFYFTELFDYSDSNFNPFTAIGIHTSTDGGQTFGPPTPAVTKSGYTHSLDKPWSTVDPSNPKKIYVSYTDFDFSGTSAACGDNFRTAIEFVHSKDGGVTWSKPVVAIEVCGNGAVQGSQMAVNSHGTMYISWVNLGVNFPLGPRTIQLSSFAGGTLTIPGTVDQVQPGGDSYYLQGEFRDFLDMAMAVDHSGGPGDGTIYVTWADGRDKIVPDPLATQGYYAYDDIFLRSSFDSGMTWGFAATKVNSDIQSRIGSGHDHYQSGVAVDKTGAVGVCWYDRRNDSENFAVQRYCAKSTDFGTTFPNVNTGLTAFAPTHGNDEFINSIYMGDYDQPGSDFLNQNPGFFSSFESQGNRGNPDIVGYRF
jgi:hypothetical protein